MSGFTAIFHRDGRLLDREQLHRMNDAIRHRGPDGAGLWVSGPVGLGHQMLRTTLESLDEVQPAANPRGDLVLVYEGLIDNAEEIRDQARRMHLRVADRTDATAILLAYELWRDECARHLSGDFAFVLWDSVARRLFCARDQLGIRPFYYHLGDRLFACGSELRQLLAHAGIRRDPNEGMAAEYLANAVTSTDETLYRDIRRLPAGHAMTVSEGQHRLWRYWTFDPARQIRYRTGEEYGDALLHEIRSAVRACSRAAGPLAVEVSGGLDSTTVASMARDLAARGELRGPIETLNIAYPGLDCDEGEWVREADRHWGCQTRRVTFSLQTRAEFDASLAAHQDFPECPNGVMHYPLYRAARAGGSRVLLGGVGGDEVFTGHLFHYADLLKGLEFGALRRHMREDNLGVPGLVRFGLRPLAPAPVRWASRALRRRHPHWISSRFANAVALSDRLHRPRFRRGHWQSRAQEEMFRDLTHGWVYHCLETLSRVLAEHGLEYRHPLLRLNVVEFGLAIPEGQRWLGADTKIALRQAMKGLLPEKIRTRRDKAEYSAIFPAAFSRLDLASVFRSLRLTSLGWIDGRSAARMGSQLDAWTRGAAAGQPETWPLWMIFGIERWLPCTAMK